MKNEREPRNKMAGEAIRQRTPHEIRKSLDLLYKEVHPSSVGFVVLEDLIDREWRKFLLFMAEQKSITEEQSIKPKSPMIRTKVDVEQTRLDVKNDIITRQSLLFDEYKRICAPTEKYIEELEAAYRSEGEEPHVATATMLMEVVKDIFKKSK